MSRAKSKTPPSKVLIVVCNKGIGDAVEALPVFVMIREHWPDVRLAAGSFSKGAQQSVFQMSPHISESIRLFGSIKLPWLAMKACVQNFKAMRGFDAILFLYKKQTITWPLLLTAKLTGATVRYKHDYRYADKRRNTYSDFPEHVFFQIVASHLLLGLPLARPRELRISLQDLEEQFADAFCHSKGLGPRPIVMINTRGIDERNWGIERFAQVANRLVEWGADVLINGGRVEQIAEFESVASHTSKAVVLLERPSCRQLAAVIARCNLFIGEPSGPTSLAMAVGTPTISVQGPGEYQYPGQERIGPVWWPRGPNHQILDKVEWCQLRFGEECRCSRPPGRALMKRTLKRLGLWDAWKVVSKKVRKMRGIGPSDRQPDVYPCLEAITVDEVVEMTKQQLCDRSRPQSTDTSSMGVLR